MFIGVTACELFRRLFGRNVFVIRLLCKTLREKRKIQEHHTFRLGFGFTTTCIMIVYENTLNSSMN